jgi:hypothetical protein
LPPAITVLFQVSFAIAIMYEFIIYFKGLWRLFRIDLVFAGDPALKYHKPPSRRGNAALGRAAFNNSKREITI